MMGVVLGTTSIVVLISLGIANSMRFDQLIEGMGDVTVITVQNPAMFGWMRQDDDAHIDIPNLDAAAVQYFLNIPGVVAASPIVQANQLFFRSGNYGISWVRVLGMRPEDMLSFGYRVQEGRLLQEGDVFEVVFGYNAERFFEDLTTREWSDRFWRAQSGDEVETYIDIWNDRITMSFDGNLIWGADTQEQDFDFDDIEAPRPVRPIPITVVGRLEHRNDWDTDGAIFMDIHLVQRLMADAERAQQQNQADWLAMDYGWGHIDASANARIDRDYDMVHVRVGNLNDVQHIREHIAELGYPAWNPTQQLEGMQGMAESQQQMLAAIGIVSLLVAAIGIANTMVMSTYERTREIGVMKVIGAALSDIRKLFLIEAAMIGFFGGVIGLAFSYLVSFLLNTYTDTAFMGGMLDWFGETDAVVSFIPPWLGLLAVGFSGAIGLLSGYFPARRAMRISALNAIRTE